MKRNQNEVNITHVLEDIRKILCIDQSLSGIDYLSELMSNIISTIDVQYAFVGHALESSPGIIQTDVVYSKQGMLDNFEYKLIATPCEIVMTGNRVCVHEHAVCSKFPDDELLHKMNVDSYAGSPTFNQDGDLLGLLVLLDNKPMYHKEYMIAILDFFAQRISAEYERYSIQEKLYKLVDSRTKQLNETNINLHKTIEELELTKKQLEIKSRVDPLTSINNRDWFTSLAISQLIIAERNDYSISLLFIDLDHFKQVNDTYGHPIGDTVLQEAALRIKRCTRGTDILGRFGGEEFAILSPYADNNSAVKLAERINDEISRTPIHTENHDIYITTSIGISVSQHANCELKQLLNESDNALYQAKEAGRNCFMIN